MERSVTSSAHDVELNVGEGMNQALLVSFDVKVDTSIYCFVSLFTDSV